LGQSAAAPTVNVTNNTNTGGGTGTTGTVFARPIGGVSIDAQGVLENVQTDALGQLAKLRAEALQKVPEGLNVFTDSRKVSLRRLEAAIEESTKSGKPLPDDIRFLAGLQQIRYVFVYPEQKDIILVGPGEGWKVDARGNMVGITTGRPVMLLDDLLVALRTAQAAAQGGITCSIDPTPEGVARFKQFMSSKPTPQQAAAGLAEAMGMQQITVEGVPATSHFAQVLVAADYRMKCLGMNLQAPPRSVKLPSYLQMVPSNSSIVGTPRWWMEPKYDPLLRDKDGLAWELCGASVQTLTEDSLFSASGQRQSTSKPNPLAKKWAENMTDQFAALALAEPVFGELRNCMELAIVGALIVKERLPDKAGYSLPVLMSSPELRPAEFNAPKHVPSQTSMLPKGQKYIISVSGGVAINSWIIADNTKQSDDAAPIRAKAAPSNDTKWWWN
ncbi:MAG: DUF1598 domain-containing protein, partial [Thermoguttaceae bacterium]